MNKLQTEMKLPSYYELQIIKIIAKFLMITAPTPSSTSNFLNERWPFSADRLALIMRGKNVNDKHLGNATPVTPASGLNQNNIL